MVAQWIWRVAAGLGVGLGLGAGVALYEHQMATDLKGQVERYRESAHSAREKSEALQASLQAAQTAMAELRRQLEQTQAKQLAAEETSQQQMKTLTDSLAVERQALSEIRQKLAALDEELANTRAVGETLKAAAATATQAKEAALHELTEAQQQHSKEVATLKAQSQTGGEQQARIERELAIAQKTATEAKAAEAKAARAATEAKAGEAKAEREAHSLRTTVETLEKKLAASEKATKEKKAETNDKKKAENKAGGTKT